MHSEEMLFKETENLTDLSSERLKYEKAEYYEGLLRSRRQIIVRFFGFRKKMGKPQRRIIRAFWKHGACISH